MARSTGWSKRYGSTGTIANPVMVGPHVLTLGLAALTKNRFDWETAVWMVNAGSALTLFINRRTSFHVE